MKDSYSGRTLGLKMFNEQIPRAMFALSIFLGVILGLISTSRGSNLLGITIIVMGAWALVLIISRHKDTRLRNILLLAFILRVGLILVHIYIMPLPDSDADAANFERLGWDLARAWSGFNDIPSISGAYLYSVVIGIVYFLFGRVQLIAQFVNAIAGILTVYLVYKITLQLANSYRSAQIAALGVAVFPTLNLYSAITMRESLIVCFAAISLYCFLLWLKRDLWRFAIGAVIALVIASILHSGMIFIAIPYILFFCFYNPRKQRWKLFNLRSIPLILLFLILTLGLLSNVQDKLPGNVSELLSPEYLSQRTAIAARDRAAYLIGMTPESLFEMVLQTPIRIAYFLFAPFPWMVTNSSDVLGFIDAFIYFFITIYGLKGLKHLRKANKIGFWTVVLILAIFLVVFSWGTSNYGTAIRHRQKIAWLMFAVASVGIADSRWWRWLMPERSRQSRLKATSSCYQRQLAELPNIRPTQE